MARDLRQTYGYVLVSFYLSIYVCKCVCMCVCVYVCMYACMYTGFLRAGHHPPLRIMRTQTHTQTHTHTQDSWAQEHHLPLRNGATRPRSAAALENNGKQRKFKNRF